MDDWASDQKKKPAQHSTGALLRCWPKEYNIYSQYSIQEPSLLFSRELFYVQSRGAPPSAASSR
jgi:hypothetical protein